MSPTGAQCAKSRLYARVGGAGAAQREGSAARGAGGTPAYQNGMGISARAALSCAAVRASGGLCARHERSGEGAPLRDRPPPWGTGCAKPLRSRARGPAVARPARRLPRARTHTAARRDVTRHSTLPIPGAAARQARAPAAQHPRVRTRRRLARVLGAGRHARDGTARRSGGARRRGRCAAPSLQTPRAHRPPRRAPHRAGSAPRRICSRRASIAAA